MFKLKENKRGTYFTFNKPIKYSNRYKWPGVVEQTKRKRGMRDAAKCYEFERQSREEPCQ